jgi:hypothetical protein
MSSPHLPLSSPTSLLPRPIPLQRPRERYSDDLILVKGDELGCVVEGDFNGSRCGVGCGVFFLCLRVRARSLTRVSLRAPMPPISCSLSLRTLVSRLTGYSQTQEKDTASHTTAGTIACQTSCPPCRGPAIRYVSLPFPTTEESATHGDLDDV